MMQRSLLCLFFTALLGLALAPAWADDGVNGPCLKPCGAPCGEGRGGGPLARLDLSDAQKGEVRALLDSERERLQPLRDEVRQGQQAMHQAFTAENVDEAEVRRLAHAQADRRVDLRLARESTRARLEALLTPEQRQEMEQLQAQRQERRLQHREFGAIRGPGKFGGPGCKGPCGDAPARP